MNNTSPLTAYVLVNLADLGVQLEQYTSDALPVYILSVTDQNSMAISVQDHAGAITKVWERAIADIAVVKFPEQKKMEVEFGDGKTVSVRFTGHKEKLSPMNAILSLFMAGRASDEVSLYGVSDTERFIQYFRDKNLTTAMPHASSRSKLPILIIVGVIIALFVLALLTVL